MFGQRDAKLAQDSPPHSNDEEIYNPFAHGRQSPPKPTLGKKEPSKILMMSTTDRESLSTRGVSFREPIARKKPSMEKTLKTYCSLCMAVFLFAGGLVGLFDLFHRYNEGELIVILCFCRRSSFADVC
jgi:hypothetical protein